MRTAVNIPRRPLASLRRSAHCALLVGPIVGLETGGIRKNLSQPVAQVNTANLSMGRAVRSKPAFPAFKAGVP
jgi:hypothetical protein